MIKIGITGSLASGKTTATKLIRKGKYPLFDADQCVKNLYKDKNFIKKIIKKFKIKKEKNIKMQIRKIIIKERKNLRRLELFIHPIIRNKMKKFSLENKKKKIILFEIPLLVESKLMKFFNIIIFVKSSKEIRLKRYLKKGGNKSLFTTLDGHQLKSDKKVKYCDHIIVNNKSLLILKNKIQNIMSKYE